MYVEYITHIKKDNLNRIIEFKTNKGNIYNFEMAKDAILFGKIKNAKIIKKDSGRINICQEDDNDFNDFPSF